MKKTGPFHDIPSVLSDIRLGKMVVVVDDEDRENEGDLVLAAEKVTPDAINFMAKHGRGLICVPTVGERLKQLGIEQMVVQNRDAYKTDFQVSVDAAKGISTGISAADRARTIQVMVDPTATPADLVQPGHVFPLRSKAGGVLRRAGHTEAAVDLARMAGMFPSGVLCEIVNDDGTMARVPDLVEFCKEHDLLLISIAELIRYRRQTEKLVKRISEARIPTQWGDFTCYVYENVLDGQQHIALVKGAVQGEDNVLVRVHSECLTGDVFGSLRCDCGIQLDKAMELIDNEGLGVVVYLRGHEGRGVGIGHKIRAYSLQDAGQDTVEANVSLGLPIDSREYGIGAQILVDLGITTMRALTNNPSKYGGLDGFGLDIVERVPLETIPNPENIGYLRTKREKMGHMLEGLD